MSFVFYCSCSVYRDVGVSKGKSVKSRESEIDTFSEKIWESWQQSLKWKRANFLLIFLFFTDVFFVIHGLGVDFVVACSDRGYLGRNSPTVTAVCFNESLKRELLLDSSLISSVWFRSSKRRVFWCTVVILGWPLDRCSPALVEFSGMSSQYASRRVKYPWWSAVLPTSWLSICANQPTHLFRSVVDIVCF